MTRAGDKEKLNNWWYHDIKNVDSTKRRYPQQTTFWALLLADNHPPLYLRLAFPLENNSVVQLFRVTY